METIRVKFIIAYDGSNYVGWQIQKNVLSIQGHIEKALSTALQQSISIVGAGRTDSGVHAEHQVAHADIPKTSLSKLETNLRGLLPEDIRILNIEPVDKNFHARFSAKNKIYQYSILTSKVSCPFRRKYTLHYSYPLDIPLIKSLCPQFEGKKDFAGFTHKLSHLSEHRSTIKHLQSLTLKEISEPYVKGFILTFIGDGFLHKMVRNIVGTLLDISCKKLPIDQIEKIFATKDRKLAGATAPALGLSLIDIQY